MFSVLHGYWDIWRWIQQGWRDKLALILLMKLYLGRSVKTKFREHEIDGLAFQWLQPHISLLPLLACLFGRYKYIWLSASLQLSHSQPSAPETHYRSFWLVINWKHLPGPLFGINRPRPNDQIWPFGGCTGIAQPNGDVDESHASEKRHQVHKLMLSLSKCEYYSSFFFQSAHPRSPSAVLVPVTTKTWMNGSHEKEDQLVSETVVMALGESWRSVYKINMDFYLWGY